MVFDHESVVTERIAEDADYQGVRATFPAQLGNAIIPMQIDIGFSDVITPQPSSTLQFLVTPRPFCAPTIEKP